MMNANPVKIPMEVGCHISKEDSPKTEDERNEMSNKPYRQLVGALMFLSCGTRPKTKIQEIQDFTNCDLFD